MISSILKDKEVESMSDSQHFCLRWNNYQSSITSAFETLRDQDEFVDVTLACEGRSLKAHRVVLSACSSYFRELLKSTPCKHPVIVLQDVTFADLNSLVEFIYHGEVNVQQKNLTSFLKTAEILRVSGLTQHAERDEQALTRDRLQVGLSTEETTAWQTRGETPIIQGLNGTATVNQLLKAAALAANRHSRERRKSMDLDERLTPTKKPRGDETPPPLPPPAVFSNGREPIELANCKENFRRSASPEQDVPADLSSVKRTSRTPSPNRRFLDIKTEPLQLLCNNRERTERLERIEKTDFSEGSPGSRDKESDNDEVANLHDLMRDRTPHYLSPDKLFPTSPFSFNMAAFASDHIGLGPVIGRSPDGLASTSQGPVSLLKKVFTCGLCTKVLCSKASLKRHVADKHSARQEEYRCHICDRVYCSRNSLMTHIYTYHKTRPGDVDVKFY